MVMVAEFKIGGALTAAFAVTTGVEKLNSLIALPTALPTVTIAESCLPYPAAERHVAYESEIQEVVAHGVVVTPAVGEKLPLPKFRPLTVTAAPPEVGPFEGPRSVTSGASKVKSRTMLLLCWPTITPCVLKTDCAGWTQTRQVSVTQLDVRHVPPTRAVEDASVSPKFIPDSVTDAPPVCPALQARTCEMAGASYVTNQLDWYWPAPTIDRADAESASTKSVQFAGHAARVLHNKQEAFCNKSCALPKSIK
jgi:hypothetical protein